MPTSTAIEYLFSMFLLFPLYLNRIHTVALRLSFLPVGVRSPLRFATVFSRFSHREVVNIIRLAHILAILLSSTTTHTERKYISWSFSNNPNKKIGVNLFDIMCLGRMVFGITVFKIFFSKDVPHKLQLGLRKWP